MKRLLLLVLVALAAGIPSGRAEAALVVGLSDQKPDTYSDVRARALGLKLARLIVPYDAVTSEPDRVQAWLDAVAAAGMTPHVAFEHRITDKCPSAPCTLPTRQAYRAAVTAFLQRWPQVRTYTTWNEANHASQPVASRPEMVAQYWEELTAACPTCTVVAGDVLDSGSYVRWLERFQAATSRTPQLWGLHNYGDATYQRSTGIDSVLATVPGQLWLEETGGIVVLRDASGRETLRYDEQRAADGIDHLFDLVATRPRVTRMYVFHWRPFSTGTFDAGLVRADGTARPSLTRLQANLGLLATTTPSSASSAAVAAPVWSARWSKVGRRPLLVRVRCAAACSGRVTATLRGTKLGVRRYTASTTFRLAVGATLRARLRRATKRTLVLKGASDTVRLSVPRP